MDADPEIVDHVSRTKSRTRGRDTMPELAVRRLLHARGHRYRVNHRPLDDKRRTVDIAFSKLRLAVMIDGCFWHACPEHYVEPKTRAEFWRAKIAGNAARDLDTDRRLVEAGWKVLRLWEHEPPEAMVTSIEEALAELSR